VREM